jgi:hypothetical protein
MQQGNDEGLKPGPAQAPDDVRDTGSARGAGGAGDVAVPESLPPAAPRAGRPRVVKEPLPPEMPRTVLPPGVRVPPMPSLPPGVPPGAPPMPSQPPDMPPGPLKEPLPPEAPRTPGAESDAEGERQEWWRSADVREEIREAWTTHGREGLDTALEIGAQIGEAISSRLPDPYAAAQTRGLDLRWLRLGLNVPALMIALLVRWGGRSPQNRVVGYVARDGVLAPLGWVLLPVLVLAALGALPFGGVFGALLGVLARGAVALLRRAWAVPYAGYLLRLAVAVAAWSFVIAAARVAGRVVITWLTGV